MNFSTRVFLVLLQLTIGWHLFYEGYWKFKEPSWSSRGYLRGAQGPLALYTRYSAGDPEVRKEGDKLVVVDPTADLKARFEIKPLDPSETPEDRRWHRYLPPPIEQEWDAYFQAFVKHYKLDEPDTFGFESVAVLAASTQGPTVTNLPWVALSVVVQREPSNPLQPSFQRIVAERNLMLAKAETARWIHEGKKKVKRPYLSGPAGEVPLTTPKRLQEYLNKVAEVRDLEAIHLNVFGSGAADRYRKAKDEENSLRGALLADLNEKTNEMKRSTREVLGYEENRMPLPPEPAPEKAPGEWAMLARIDTLVKWCLVIFGGCLIVGLLTRLACVGASVLLLMFYLAQPALAGLPDNPMSPGHYLIVNMNIIEIVALLTITVAHTGLWYGLDAWLDALKPWKWKSAGRAEQARALGAPHSSMKPVPLNQPRT